MAAQSGFDVQAFLQSPAGAALISSVGGGLSAYGAKKSDDENRAQSASQFAAGLHQRQGEQQSQNAQGVLNASPLGADQKFAQQNSLMNAILPGLRNQRSTPGDPGVAAAMGTRVGGLRLPEGGLDPSMIQSKFGDEATMASIAQRSKNITSLDPNAATADLNSLYGTAADGQMAGMQDFRTQRLDEQDQRQKLIQQAIDNDLTGEKQKKEGSGWKKKLLKAALIAAPIVAAPFTGGASLAAIGALSGAASGAMNGGGVKGALLGGAMGAIPMGGGLAKGAVAPALGAGLKQAAKSVVTNPANALNLASAIRR